MLLARAMLLGRSEFYCVVTVDPETDKYDVHGPWDFEHAQIEAGRLRSEFDRVGLGDVLIHVAEYRGND